jgi:hypothetical protein
MGCLFSKKNEILLDMDNHNVYDQSYFRYALDDSSSVGSFEGYDVSSLSRYVSRYQPPLCKSEAKNKLVKNVPRNLWGDL